MSPQARASYTWLLIAAFALFAVLYFLKETKRGSPVRNAGDIPQAALPSAQKQEALIVKLPLAGGRFGSDEERTRIKGFESNLEEAIKKTPAAGEFDGDEFGEGTCTLYMYGPSADQLLTITSPTLRKIAMFPGSVAIRRYGAPGATQVTTSLNALP
jgi:hypothetical protein